MTEERSALLVVGYKEGLSPALENIVRAFPDNNIEAWINEIRNIGEEEVTPSLGALTKLSMPLKVSNKYFSAEVDVHVMTNPDPYNSINLEGYDGLLTILPPPFKTGTTPKSWLYSGSGDNLLLRLSLIHTDKNDFDIDQHMQGMDEYTETVVDDLQARPQVPATKLSDAEEDDVFGIERVKEAINETTWRGYVEHKKNQQTSKSTEINQTESNKEQASRVTPKEEQKNSSNGNPLDAIMGMGGGFDDMDDQFLEDDMKLFEEIVAFKAMSTSLTPEQRKQMADKLFSKLSDAFGDDM